MGNWARDNSKQIFHRGKKPMDGPSYHRKIKLLVVVATMINHIERNVAGFACDISTFSQ